MSDDDPDTVPIHEHYLEVATYHGRDFHQYALENNIYHAPVDEDEAERLRISHDVFNMLFGNRLIFPAPFTPQRILDCGFGSASWAIDVAEQYPDSEVYGVDIYSGMAPLVWPPNLTLQIDNLNELSTFDRNSFDLVHSREMSGGIMANWWPTYVAEMFALLRPGGWCQMVETYYNAQSDNGSLTDTHALRRWSLNYLHCMSNGGFKDPRVANRLPNLMRAAGFVQVETQTISLPLSGWSTTDAAQRDIGVANRANVHRLLSSLAIYPFTEYLGMTPTEVQFLAAQARVEADNPSLKAYFPVVICIGRKPGTTSRSGGSKGHHTRGRTGDSRKRARH